MIPSIKNLSPDVAQKISGVFFDIDDTITSKGKLLAGAFNAIWSLRENGLKTVAITGRPAGWCDHIARMWPVDGVVGENGAFYFWLDENKQKLKKRYVDDENTRADKRKRLQKINEKILAAVPGTALASDQPYRDADLAIDYCEDVPTLNPADVAKICTMFQEYGATCKVSSIHVNGWFGDYNKLNMTKIFVKERWGLDLDQNKDQFLFCGDSPNDEPMFQYFPFSVGVSNIIRFVDQMNHLPAFITKQKGGEGFAAMVSHLLLCRQA
jgi:HAD superfamily hydrolase (TIGR01484 family)